MSVADPLQAMRVPGRLMINPADVTVPADGTELGLLMDVAVKRQEGTHEIVAMEFGMEPVDALRLGERWSLTAALRGFDADAIATRFPTTFTGSSSNLPGIRHPDPTANLAGTRFSGDSVVLRFTPDDPTRHQGVLFYRALPILAEDVDMSFHHDAELVILVGFLAVRNTNGRLVEVALLEDMTAP